MIIRKASTHAGHAKPINSASFTPDGKYMISTAEDKLIKIWDLNTQ